MKPLVSVVIPTKDRLKDLKRLIVSINNSNYTNLEIIVVNNSLTKLCSELFGNLKNLKIIENFENLGIAEARNIGAKNSKGKYILFVDDDNILKSGCIENLVTSMESFGFIGCGPTTYYFEKKDKVWFLSSKYNFLIHKFKNLYKFEDVDIFENRFVKTDVLHNCFMVERDLGNKIGWFDKKIFMSGTEFDFFLRVKAFQTGELVTDIKSICFHDVPYNTKKESLRTHGISSIDSNRIFYIQRNRGIIASRHGNILDVLGLFFIFYPLYFLYYTYIIAKNKEYKLLSSNLKGVLNGYKYLLFKII